MLGDQLRATHREILDVMTENLCSAEAASIKIGLSHGSGRARIKTAIRNHGVEAILNEYPSLRGLLPGTRIKDPARPPMDVPYNPKFSMQAMRAQQVLANARGIVPKALLDVVEQRTIAGTPDPEPVDTKNLLPAIQQRLGLALGYIDNFNLGTAKLSEVNATLKTLFEISQVLQGKPTSISHSENVRALKDLVPALVREAQRRGIQIDGTAERVEPRPKHRSKKSKEPSASPSALQAAAVQVDRRGRPSFGFSAQIEALSAEEGGPEAHLPRGFAPGPVEPRTQSEFSKILADFDD